MELRDDILSNLKQVELGILNAFVDVCNHLNLKYYLLHGTLLGAVRHKGFIPWDDDIDVGMMRSDYEIFLQEGQKLLPNNLFVQASATDPEYFLWFAKIRNVNTTFIEKTTQNISICHGVFIDLFPLDYYPEDRLSQIRIQFYRKWIVRRISCELLLPDSDKMLRKLKCIFLRVLMPSLISVLQKRDSLFLYTKASSLIVNYGGTFREILPTEWFGDGCMLQFEDRMYRVPVAYQQYLSHVYGDYLTLPPPELRKGHHYTHIIDLSRPYTDYTHH